MYKIFHGFALVEAYQNLKKAKRLAENKSVSRFVKLAIAIVVSLVLWCLPIEIFGGHYKIFCVNGKYGIQV